MYKVLIVEDEELIRKGLQFVVPWQSMGCVVVGEAINGKDGLEKIKIHRPDIVLSDIRMPEMDGLEMLQKSIEKYKYQAILLSGYSEFEYARQAIGLGVSEYLLKPVDFQLLQETIKRICSPKNAVECIAKNRYVNILLKYIEENYPSRISISDISEQYEISTNYLNSKFKEETGYTFNDYLNRHRVSVASKLLQEGNLKVYEIAMQVGFIDYKYFVKVFKKYTGARPTELQKNEE